MIYFGSKFFFYVGDGGRRFGDGCANQSVVFGHELHLGAVENEGGYPWLPPHFVVEKPLAISAIWSNIRQIEQRLGCSTMQSSRVASNFVCTILVTATTVAVVDMVGILALLVR